MIVIGIDPGTIESAWVKYETETQLIYCAHKWKNDAVRGILHGLHAGDIDVIGCEKVMCYGMPAGESLFETVYWTGIFRESAEGIEFLRIPRKTVCAELCGSARAKDGNIRQALIDLFPATGGGKCPQIGTKGHPGPLYGISGDCWSALAVAITVGRRCNGF
jgi:hypothetical protein